MEFRQLKYFATIVEEGSFTAAARKCGVAQPSLSQQIQNLENELGESLLKRNARGVAVTDAGKLVYDRALTMISEEKMLVKSFEDRGSIVRAEVSVGIIPTIAPSFLPEVLPLFREEFKDIRINVREARTSEQIKLVVDEEVDFAILSDIDATTKSKYSLHISKLFEEPILLAIHYKHRLADLSRPLEVDEIGSDELLFLSEGHCLRGQTITICRAAESAHRTCCEQLPTLLSMVREGLGATFVPAMFARENAMAGVVFKNLRNPSPSRSINIMKRRGRKLNAVADKLMKLFQTAGAEIAAVQG
ncbi:MAG: LysR substrate-binding domain-containing protein [Verrucomicrobiota bacterium]